MTDQPQVTEQMVADASKVLRGWAKAYRDGPKHLRFPSDPNAEFFPADLEFAARVIDALSPWQAIKFDLNETLKAVLHFWGPGGAEKVTRHVLLARRSRDTNTEIDSIIASVVPAVSCDHKHYNWEKHGCRCTCGVIMAIEEH